MDTLLRKTGIGIVGDMPSGTQLDLKWQKCDGSSWICGASSPRPSR